MYYLYCKFAANNMKHSKIVKYFSLAAACFKSQQ